MRKKCTKCSLTIPIESFYNNKRTKDGKNSWCKKCIDNAQNAYYRTPEGRYTTLKKDAKSRKIFFSLTLEEYKEIYNDFCGYCGSKVKNAAGIDRIDNNKGYEKGNIISSCKWCNYAKGTWSPRAFYEKCLLIVENFPDNKKIGEGYSDDLKR